MKQSKRTNESMAPVIKVFLTKEENARYEALLEPWGGKKGPYAKQLILRDLATAGSLPPRPDTLADLRGQGGAVPEGGRT